MKTLCGVLVFRVLLVCVMAASVGLVILSSNRAQAELIGLGELIGEDTFPDIFLAGEISYDAGTRTLSTGYSYPCAYTYPNPSDPYAIDGYSMLTTYAPWPQSGFTIHMELDEANQPVNGTVEVRGYIPGIQGCVDGETDPYIEHSEYYDWANDSVLLTGDIVQFGYDDTLWEGGAYSEYMDMIVNPTGGVLHDTYGQYPGQIGIVLYYTGYHGSFDVPFSGSTLLADLFPIPVPEPSSLVLLLTFFVSSLIIQRRR